MKNTTLLVKLTTFSLFILAFSFFTPCNAQIIATVAGNGTGSYSGDGGQATAAELHNPAGAVFDASGNMYIADAGNNRIRKVSTSGVITTVVGNGTAGYTGDGGQATAAEINTPRDVAMDASGNMYIVDFTNNRIRKINTSGVISTYAGNGTNAFAGDGGQATAAELSEPSGIAIDASGNLYIADYGDEHIRKVNTSGVISSVAGNGTLGYSGDGGQATAAELDRPYHVAVDGSGNLFISDGYNYRIRKVNTSGVISTYAGDGTAGYSGDGGQATAAELNVPTGVVDVFGNVYIADANNERVRKVNTSGIISTAAGNGTAGYSGDGGQATAAELDTPYKLAFDAFNNIYIADYTNNRIRVIYLSLNVSTSVTANVSCSGSSTGSASATAIHGTTPYTYSWSGGGTNSTKTGMSAGTYTITVTDNKSITGTATVIITQPSALTVSANATTNVLCHGSSTGAVSATPTGGASPYTYSWSGGGTNSTKTGLSAGTYTISITDHNGCTASASVSVTQPGTFAVVSTTQVNVSCNGGSNGSVAVTLSGGTLPYTYSWTNGETTATATGLAAGLITYTAKDNCGTTIMSSHYTITQPTALSVSAVPTTNVLCNGSSTGAVSATPSGGTTPYMYSWSGGGTNSAKTGISAGTYTITTTDHNGCTATASVSITQPTVLTVSAVAITNVLCNGNTTGAVSATVSGGTSPYTYSWSTGPIQTTQSATRLSAGTYSITITDNRGCSATASVIMTQPTSLYITANAATSPICYGNPDQITSTVSGGIPPYTYIWSPTTGLNCSTCQNPISTPASSTTYTVNVIDYNGCSRTTSVSISINPIPNGSIRASSSNILLYGIDSLTASGGSNYLWSTGDTVSSIIVAPDSLTTYSVLATNTNGCSTTYTTTIGVTSVNLSASTLDTNIYQAYAAFMQNHTPSKGDTIEDSPYAEFMKWYNYWEPRLGPTGSFKLGAQAYGTAALSLHEDASGAGSHSPLNFCSTGTPIATACTELGINTHSYFTSGQVRCIDFDPTNSSIMYAGGIDGGVYQSTNAGANWVNMGTDNQLLSLGTSDIVVEPTNHNIVYVATGDAQGFTVFSDGIYRTGDANDANNAVWTWQGPLKLYSNYQYIHQLAIDPNNVNYLYAAIDDPAESSLNHNGGIWYANNRQAYPTALNWVQDPTWGFSYENSVTHQTYASDAAFSVVTKTFYVKSTPKTQLYAAGYDIKRKLSSGGWQSITGPNSGLAGSGSGLDLTPMSTGSGIPFQLSAGYFVDPGNPNNQLYLTAINLFLTNDGKYLYATIFTANTKAVTWQTAQYEFIARYNIQLGGWDISPNRSSSVGISTFPFAWNSNSTSLQSGRGLGCVYAHGRKALAIDPNPMYNDNRIFVGTTDLSESLDGGVTWLDDFGYFNNTQIISAGSSVRSVPSGPHVDFHEIKYQPGTSGIVYLGTDGGLSSFPSTQTFTPSNVSDLDEGLGLSIDYDAQSSEQNVGDVWQTLTDDCSNRLLNNSYLTWLGGLGDGMNGAIDYLNNTNVYLSGIGGGTYYISGANSTDPYPSANVNYNNSLTGFDPFFLNPYNPNTMYEGRQDVQKCNDVEKGSNCLGTAPTCWDQLSSFQTQIGPGGYVVQEMAVAPSDTNFIYASLSPLNPTDYFRFVWSQDGGGAGPNDWTDVTPDNNNYGISGVAVSYLNPYHVWLSYGGNDLVHHKVKEGWYNLPANPNHWTWTDDNTGLCNFNINCIVYENGSNDGVYIGTDAGVYYINASLESSGAGWQRVSTNFPNVMVSSLSINYCSRKLIVGTKGRGAWEINLVPSTSTPLQITSNTTWKAPPSESAIMIPADVEVKAPNTLTIASGLTVNMSQGHQIIVDPGATLTVNGTITNACGGLWAGIQLNGNTSQNQTSTYQGTVILNAGSTIENAVTGITTNSGIIIANGANFTNNQRDVQLSAYTPPNGLSNRCRFANCMFDVTTSYIWLTTHTYPIEPRVTLSNIHGVQFHGNTFENLIPTTGTNSISDIYDRGTGINSIDASYEVDNCSTIFCGSACCGTPNTFTGFEFGILAANSNPAFTIQIDGNTFTDNFADIGIQNINNVIITKNTFTKTTNEGTNNCIPYCAIPYNIYLDQCTGYNVSWNSLSNSYYTNSYGTVINNSYYTNNLVNNNIFNGIYVQSQSQGINGVVLDELGVPLTFAGLQYQCNQYTSTVPNGADISVASGLIDPMQGSCTTALTTENNTFNNACSTTSTADRLNIYTYPTIDLAWNIFYSTATSGPAPHCTSPTVFVNTCGGVSSSSCPATTYTINTTSGNLLTASGINYHSTLRTQKQYFNKEMDSLQAVLNVGNSSQLYNAIATQTGGVLEKTLLGAGPYLSDGVLKATIRSSFSQPFLTAVLIANAPLDSTVVSVLDSVPLPDSTISKINQYQSDAILSPRSQLTAGISYYQGFMDYTDNALITALETDTNIVNAFDSAQIVLKSDSLTLSRYAQLASLQMAAGETQTLLATLATMQRLDVASTYHNYCTLLPVLNTLNSNSNGYLSLIGNQADSILIEQIAMDTLTPGYANARAVLEFVYNQAFDEPILPLNFQVPRKAKTNNNLYVTSNGSTGSPFLGLKSPFNLYPNPANSELTIQYSLENNVQNASIELFDELGNKVETWQIPISQTQITENTGNLSAGFYLYSIFVNNQPVQRGKLIIER